MRTLKLKKRNDPPSITELTPEKNWNLYKPLNSLSNGLVSAYFWL